MIRKWYCGKTILWQNDILAKSYFGKMILWQNNILAKSYLGIHTGRFPNKHTVQSKRFCKLVRDIAANWMAEKPPIQRSLIFTGKTAARTSWSKRTPQEPESCATKSDFDLLIRLHRTARCAKGGARLSCVLSLRVPGRRDAAVHGQSLETLAHQFQSRADIQALQDSGGDPGWQITGKWHGKTMGNRGIFHG